MSAVPIEKSAMSAIAPRGERGRAESQSRSRANGRDAARIEPVTMTRHICIANSFRPKNPSPQAVRSASGVAAVTASASRKVMALSATAMTSGSGIQRSDQPESAAARRASIGDQLPAPRSLPRAGGPPRAGSRPSRLRR